LIFVVEAMYVLWVTFYLVLPWNRTFREFDNSEWTRRSEIFVLGPILLIAIILVLGAVAAWQRAARPRKGALRTGALIATLLIQLGIAVAASGGLVDDSTSDRANSLIAVVGGLALAIASAWLLLGTGTAEQETSAKSL
jgi:hypothetical protein